MSEYNIIDYGACGDGKTICTQAIQHAINQCKNGDKVIIPKGRFVSGAIFLKSDMTLKFESNAFLIGSTNVDDYPIMRYRFEGIETECYASLINSGDGHSKNITIEGKGTIDASGEYLCKEQTIQNKGKRGRAICIRNTQNIEIKNIAIYQSPSWCLHFIYCQDIIVDSISVFTKYDKNHHDYIGITNGDGIDVDSCQNVIIKKSLIASQDDCIAIKSGKNEEGRKIGIPSNNVKIENCHFISGCGIAIGSEMSGGIYDVSVDNCTFENVLSIISLKTQRGRGGKIQNISFSNCKINNCNREIFMRPNYKGVIYIDSFYKCGILDQKSLTFVNEKTPCISNIRLTNIEITSACGLAFYIKGLPEKPIDNVVFTNVVAKCELGMDIENITSIGLNNVIIETNGYNGHFDCTEN